MHGTDTGGAGKSSGNLADAETALGRRAVPKQGCRRRLEADASPTGAAGPTSNSSAASVTGGTRSCCIVPGADERMRAERERRLCQNWREGPP